MRDNFFRKNWSYKLKKILQIGMTSNYGGIESLLINVYRKIMANVKGLNEYLVEIIVNKEDTCFPDYINLKIDKNNIYQELMELVEGKRERVYATHGMADIDIFKSGRENKYCIEWSPNEASYHYFYFEKENFMNNFIRAFMPDDEKVQY